MSSQRAAEITALMTQLTKLMGQSDIPTETPKPRFMPEPVLLTVEEAGERLRIGKTKMYSLVKTREIESVLIGRLRRIHVDAVNDYAARLV